MFPRSRLGARLIACCSARAQREAIVAFDTTIFTSEGLVGAARDSILGELSSLRCFEFGVECAEVAGGERAIVPRTGCAPEEDSPYL